MKAYELLLLYHLSVVYSVLATDVTINPADLPRPASLDQIGPLDISHHIDLLYG